MISRRLIRVKVFKVLFSRINSGSDSFSGAEKELLLSCDKTLELYYFISLLPIALKKVAEIKIEAGLKKFQPTPEEKDPNRRFVDNLMIAKLESNEALIKFCEGNGLRWNEYETFVKKLFATLTKRDYYQEYMASSTVSFEEDLKFVINFFEEELEDNEELYTILEDSNLYWIDDLAFVINIILKKLYGQKSNSKIVHPQVFMKEDDREFALRLLTQAMINYDEYIELMTKYVLNWDPDRLAATDTSLIVLGITEAISFPNIPLKVTINEYVELAKYYSTPNSKVFVNGILDKILLGLQRDGKIEKSGRGLVGSIE
ncbi:MAG: transcription antitermination protein NusB [Bacteroidales bacterium]